jgi:large repetitive protein
VKAATLLTVLVVALGAGVALTSGRAADRTPTPVITSKPLPFTSSRTATFAFTDTDLAATFECSLDGDAFSVCLSPKKYSSLPDGTHTFSVRAIDPANTEPTSEAASYTWTIDKVAPPLPTIQGPANPTNSTSATFVFSDSEAGVTYECQLDGSGFPPCSNPTSFAGPLADGDHTLRAKAVDAAGNESAVSSYTWTVDTVAGADDRCARDACLHGLDDVRVQLDGSDPVRVPCRRGRLRGLRQR